ncbi:hypothetical protein CIC12_32190 [Burkholderia sp. SG-MS1]|uniref:hypothetical protein n=1 Tax=Paraburkholderia sp. SG-MS1 TaxID=2023741 RepID=UPI001444FF3C|nr:hypothetical protein [Paraburkholderia sp. SG-MS1]NKJ51297.1 hypothetical protein [Paraburkholderia sp. SG-MS1]
MLTSIRNAFERIRWTQFSDHVVVFVFASSLYAAVLYNAGLHAPFLRVLLALVIVLAIGFYGYLSRAEWRTAILAIAFIAVVLVSYGFLREFSYDGLNYHSAVALALDQQITGVTGAHEIGGMFWAEHYPKAFEFFAYTAHVLTTRFNSGKSFTLLLSVPAVVCLMQVFRSAGRSGRTALAAAVVCVYNPVALGQITTLYVDAAHYYCWTIFSVNLLFAVWKRPYSAVQLGAALVLLIGSKMTGPVFAGISILVIFAAALVVQTRHGFLRNHRKVFGQLAVWSVVAVLIVGYSPYMQNVLAGKHVFYPILGKEKLDILSRQASPHFLSLNPLHRLVLSYFSLPSNCTYCTTAEPTFDLSKEHLRDAFVALHTADTRFSGFGPFFGAMLVLGVIAMFGRKKDGNIVKIYLLTTLAIVLLHPQSWWARYVPMLYAVPLLAAAGFSPSRRIFYAIIALGLLNSLLAAGSVAGYIMLKQIHYRSAVASVHDMCEQRPLTLPPSLMNWQFDLRDDNFHMSRNGAPPETECAVNFDQLMIMKK